MAKRVAPWLFLALGCLLYSGTVPLGASGALPAEDEVIVSGKLVDLADAKPGVASVTLFYLEPDVAPISLPPTNADGSFAVKKEGLKPGPRLFQLLFIAGHKMAWAGPYVGAVKQEGLLVPFFSVSEKSKETAATAHLETIYINHVLAVARIHREKTPDAVLSFLIGKEDNSPAKEQIELIKEKWKKGEEVGPLIIGETDAFEKNLPKLRPS